MDDYFFSDYYYKLEDSIRDQSAFGRLSIWIPKHTQLAGRPYSFKDHEFQEAIVDSTHHNNVTIKPSQVGLTEIIIRLQLGFIAVEDNVVAMYLLPTESDFERMAKSRVDPVVSGSRTLKDLIMPGKDSASFKQFGNSQLVMGGTKGKEIISVPTDLLVIDEYDFCDFTNVVTAESRLTHSRFITDVDGTEVRGIKHKFSTPTAVGRGVDKLYKTSDQQSRLVRCAHCNNWFYPDFYLHCEVPGYEGNLDDLTHLEALNLDAKGLVSGALLRCPHYSCRKPITKQNLGPEFREWVAAYPTNKNMRGYRVSPFDVPAFHSPASILRKFIDYEGKKSKFKNYVLGRAHSDASNSFLDEKAKEVTILPHVLPSQAKDLGYYGCIAGLDIGKTSWLIIGRPNRGTGVIPIIHMEQIKLASDGETLREVVLERLRQFSVRLLVCDLMPYTDAILQIQSARPEGWVLPNAYTLPVNKLDFFDVRSSDHTISSNHLKIFDYTSSQFNAGKYRLPNCPEIETFYSHLQGIKKIERLSVKGEEAEWVKEGPDHYAHALVYLTLADLALSAGNKGNAGLGIPSILGVTVGGQYQAQQGSEIVLPHTCFR